MKAVTVSPSVVCDICGHEHTLDDLNETSKQAIREAEAGIGLSPPFETAREATEWALAQDIDDEDILGR